MKTKLYAAAALSAALLFGTAGLTMAQGTPPVGDPTAGSADTPASGKNAKTAVPEKQTTGTATVDGKTSPPPPAQR